MITNDGVYFDFPKEATSGFDDAEEEHSDGDADGGVDTVLDASEDSDKDASEEDDDFEG